MYPTHMNGYIGYIRVSTVKQGTTGVSLIEQRDAILKYAERHQFMVTVWLEETETAAKQGRPIFNQALKLLRGGKFQGIILHKLDRGARNLRDWTSLGELSDRGVEIHFVTESLDLQSRGGRLSADIQAVVAADYIRNLREETRKGFDGRLKQGLYPLPAPLGYLNQGKGKPKTIDPVMGPIVRQAFELYGTARYNFESLGQELHLRGLRNRQGGRVTRNGLSTLLNNSFYIGLIQIHKTGESFVGIHEPLISKTLFDRVRAVLTGKVSARTQRHVLQYRRMLSCHACHYSLIGESQKGHVYYRCHSKSCLGTSIREEVVGTAVEEFLQRIRFNDREREYLRSRIKVLRATWASRQEEETRNLSLRLGQIKDRLNRLTDAYLDQALDRVMFEDRKKGLLLEQKAAEEQLALKQGRESASPDRVEEFLELAGNAWLSHQKALPEEKRELLRILTSNRFVEGKKVDLKPSLPFQEIANRVQNDDGDPERIIPRTLDRIIEVLASLNTHGQLPDLSSLENHQALDVSTELSMTE